MTTPAHSPGPADAEGFFWCSSCKKVVVLSEQLVETALSMPAGSLLELKCPGCHHHTVRWKVVTASRPQHPDGRVIKPPLPPVDPVRASELFADIYQKLKP